MDAKRVGRRMLFCLGAAGGLGLYAFFIEPRWLQTTRTTVCLPGLPPILSGLRIVLLTDLHAGGGTPLSLIERACRRAMAARPDLIALTGDFAALDDIRMETAVGVLRGLRAPLGVYAVPGNHDHEKGIAAWRQAIARYTGITDLTNGAVVREVGGGRLRIAGVDDCDEGRPNAAVVHPEEQVHLQLVLAHNPDFAERLRSRNLRVDLVLSGHTHGGQVRLPWIGALYNPARHDELYEAGLRKRPWAQVYVSRGIGTVHLPVRFLCRPEVAVLELVSARPDHPE